MNRPRLALTLQIFVRRRKNVESINGRVGAIISQISSTADKMHQPRSLSHISSCFRGTKTKWSGNKQSCFCVGRLSSLDQQAAS